jgi:GT2 family glycosyltransferase
MSAPAISVAMSVYNCERFLAPAIESILSQSFTDFEFLILNDGSRDRSAEIINGYAAQDQRIRPIHRENKGLIVSLNQLLAEARAPLIARMDGDDISKPERFAQQIAFMTAHPDHGVLGTWTEDMDEDGEPYHMTGSDHPVTNEEFQSVVGERSPLCHPSVMMRRDLALEVGGYHAAFRHCEDYDLWLRLASRTKICSIPERLLRYRHSDGQVSTKHIVEQQYGVAVSRLAWQAREAGRADPTEHLDHLPPFEGLDALFGMEGLSARAREMVAEALLYSPVALKGSGFGIIVDHVHDSAKTQSRISGLPRTILRLMRLGEPVRAASLAAALMLG